MPLPMLPTCLVGSYPQPDWLIDRKKLASRFPPRVRARELWRVAPEWLEEAQDDATLLAIREQERAGLDIITDGEIRRESYSNRFATALEGVQIDEPYMQARPEKARQYGLKVLNRALADISRPTAVHICFGYAAIIHERPSGYSFLPELAHSHAGQVSIETAQSALDCSVLTALSEKIIILGVLDLSDMSIETAETVAQRIRRALPYVAPERLIIAPDCGLKYLPRDVAFGKMRAMVAGAAIVRREVGSR